MIDENNIKLMIEKELNDSMEKYPLFNSTHEGWAIIKEELEEAKEEIEIIESCMKNLWNDIRNSHDIFGKDQNQFVEIYYYTINAIKELIQVAAMAKKGVKSVEGRQK